MVKLVAYLLLHRHRKNKSKMNTYSYLIRSSSAYQQRKSSLHRRCLTLAKQKKTRFYILRRCVTMLVCWNDNKYD
ncbi:hypothetical protein QVD17_26424 [Tagetes erecta]|uniref:Uncharacterized protein n=1 Tax=Tagetes erecta TaxID=13708 RepID=A0AAD8K7E8_TARER|nr:hypothetical protein QVD17_26424 [Tagetes erecta]